MLKDFSVLFVFASVKIVTSENLPQVIVPPRKLCLPQNPPRLPRIFLSEQKFTLPQFCCNASEWDDVDLSLKILADYTESEPERSAFASLINLIKFILIKEELSCLNAMTGPILQVNRPEGKIFNAFASSQILNKIESALANKPKQKAAPIEFYDSIDITNMIPIWRPRGNNRRKNLETESKSNCTCNAGPKVLQNLGPGLTIIGSSLNALKSPGKSGCPCSKCQPLTLNMPNPCNLKCQNLPSTNVKPVVIGCGGNCNICQKLQNPVLSGCPKQTTAVLSGCPKTNLVLGGCPCSNTVLGCPSCPGGILGSTNAVLGCPSCSGDILAGANTVIGCPSCSGDILASSPCKAKQSLTVLQSETVPLMNCFGNLMKQVTTTVLVPYTVSQLVA